MSRTWLVLAAALGGGCGLIDEDITDFRLSLPETAFEVDSSMMGIEGAGMEGMVPEVPCPPAECGAADLCSGSNCEAACGTMGTCELTTTLSLYKEIDVDMSNPELREIDNTNGIHVTLDEVTFRVDTNTLNLEIPQLEVYVGTIAAIDPSHPDARHIGTIQAVPPMFVGTGSLQFTDTGKDSLEEFMSNYTTPFHLIVSTELVIGAGDMLPAGAMNGIVTGTARAGVL